MLQGKRAIVFGVANARSIAWGIADRWRREGAEVFITYQNERFRKPVEKLLNDRWDLLHTNGPIPAAPCDVSNEEEIAALWQTLQEMGFCDAPEGATGNAASATTATRLELMTDEKGATTPLCRRQEQRSGEANERGQEGGEDCGFDRTASWEGLGRKKIDAILHSVAHAPTEAMQRGFVMGTSKEAFVSAHVVSAYSLVSITRHALPFLAPGASVTALTYVGSQRAVANYNVMGPAKSSLESCARALAQELGGNPASVGPGGIRVNCLSPAPVRTMAARGITGFDEMRQDAARRAPLGRGPSEDEIAGVATFLASSLGSSVTGQTVYADCGFSAVV